jgi:hypothetical protein
MAAFHADQRRDLSLPEDSLHVIRRQRELQGLGILAHHAMDDVDLFERCGYGSLTRQIGGHVHRPELRAHPTSLQAADVGHDRGL